MSEWTPIQAFLCGYFIAGVLGFLVGKLHEIARRKREDPKNG